MTQKHKEELAGVYNTLATLVPVPSEEYSEKHYRCLAIIRKILKEEASEEHD